MNMKKTTLILAAVLIIAVAMPSFVSAQYAKSDITFNHSTLYASAKYMLSEESDRNALENLKLVNAKAFSNFSKVFKGAKDIFIMHRENSTFISCMVDGTRTRILYNAKGKWQHTLRYIEPSKIPSNVIALVTGAYEGFTILRGIHVIVGVDEAYLVDIERCKEFKTIRVVGNEFDVYQEFMQSK